MKAIVPTWSIGLLMAIGFVDLVVTAVLHARGEIVELNPLMRVFIEQSEWMFAAVKSATLVAAWVVMARYAARNREFVQRICLFGSLAYVTVWCMWFTGAR